MDIIVPNDVEESGTNGERVFFNSWQRKDKKLGGQTFKIRF
jgi:hypothetical protein